MPIWLWINTYENTIFRGMNMMNIHFNPSYFDVNRRGTIGFDPSPYVFIDVYWLLNTAWKIKMLIYVNDYFRCCDENASV